MRAYNSGSEGGTVTSVRFASPFPPAPFTASMSPFFARHQAGADKRVLVVYASDLVGPGAPLDAFQVLLSVLTGGVGAKDLLEHKGGIGSSELE